jgi:hypothetical protein
MQNVILFPTFSSFFLHDGFQAKMRPGAASGTASCHRGGEENKKNLRLEVRGRADAKEDAVTRRS